jgi:hypothetical protein
VIGVGAVRPAAAGYPAPADHLSGHRITGESDADDESFGILVFAGVRLAFSRVQEEPSAPHLRLACKHLQNSSANNIGASRGKFQPGKKRVTVPR